MGEILSWVMSGLLAAVFIAANVANISLLLGQDGRKEGKHSSPIVFAGGIAGAIALAIAPNTLLNDYFWVPLLIDLGTGPLGAVLNIVWLILAGIWIAIAHLVIGVGQCVTLIGIPFGIQHFKLAVIALAPIGRVVVRV